MTIPELHEIQRRAGWERTPTKLLRQLMPDTIESIARLATADADARAGKRQPETVERQCVACGATMRLSIRSEKRYCDAVKCARMRNIRKRSGMGGS